MGCGGIRDGNQLKTSRPWGVCAPIRFGQRRMQLLLECGKECFQAFTIRVLIVNRVPHLVRRHQSVVTSPMLGVHLSYVLPFGFAKPRRVVRCPAPSTRHALMEKVMV